MKRINKPLFLSLLLSSFFSTQIIAQTFFTPTTPGAATGTGFTSSNVVSLGSGTLNANGCTGNDLTAVGVSALSFNTSGADNTGIGYQSLQSNSTGSNNTAVGSYALYLAQTSSGSTAVGFGAAGTMAGGPNDAFGYQALFGQFPTTGTNNTAIGANALWDNSTGSYNVAVGQNSLYNNIGGNQNTAVGYIALQGNTSGVRNCGLGYQALNANSTGSYNTAMGISSLQYTTGSESSAFGGQALQYFTSGVNDAFGYQSLYGVFGGSSTGTYNTGIGAFSLTSTTTGSYNTGVGQKSLYNNSTGGSNVSVGNFAMNGNSSGSYNVALGMKSLYNNGAANSNVGIGYNALYANSGSTNTAVGENAGSSQSTYTDCTFIGGGADASGSYTNATAVGFGASVTASNTVQLGNTSVTNLTVASHVVWSSDGRVKKDVQENVPGLAFIKELRPVTYHYDMHKMDEMVYGDKAAAYEKKMGDAIDAKGKIQYTGFIAQEVEASARKVGYDFSGVKTPQNDHDMYGLAYSDFVVPLVKGMQEQQGQIEAQASTIAAQANQITTLQKQIDDLCNGGCAGLIGSNSADQSGQTNKLLQNVPNPFSNETVIGYVINAGTAAYMNINGLDGKLIKHISLSINGKGSVNFSSAEFGAGTYTYTLYVDGNVVDTKLMVITAKD